MCKCVNVQMCKCLDVQMWKCVDTPLHAHMSPAFTLIAIYWWCATCKVQCKSTVGNISCVDGHETTRCQHPEISSMSSTKAARQHDWQRKTKCAPSLLFQWFQRQLTTHLRRIGKISSGWFFYIGVLIRCRLVQHTEGKERSGQRGRRG